MSNYTLKKKALLKWLKQGNCIERCSEPGPSFGIFAGINKCPVSEVKSFSNRLFRDGKLTYTTFYSLGLRWERYTPVNDNGDKNV